MARSSCPTTLEEAVAQGPAVAVPAPSEFALDDIAQMLARAEAEDEAEAAPAETAPAEASPLAVAGAAPAFAASAALEVLCAAIFGVDVEQWKLLGGNEAFAEVK